MPRCKRINKIIHEHLIFFNLKLSFTLSSGLTFGFGWIINDSTLTQVNLIKVAINFGYIYFFFHYTNDVKDRRLAWKQLTYCGAFMAVIFAYALFEDRSVLKFRFGMIFTAIIFALIASPFLRLVSKREIHCF